MNTDKINKAKDAVAKEKYLLDFSAALKMYKDGNMPLIELNKIVDQAMALYHQTEMEEGRFSLNDVTRIFFDYSTYRNSEEMHNEGDPLEFEEWADKYLQPKEGGREVEFLEWANKNHWERTVSGKWYSMKLQIDAGHTASELFQLFLKQNPKP